MTEAEFLEAFEATTHAIAWLSFFMGMMGFFVAGLLRSAWGWLCRRIDKEEEL